MLRSPLAHSTLVLLLFAACAGDETPKKEPHLTPPPGTGSSPGLPSDRAPGTPTPAPTGGVVTKPVRDPAPITGGTLLFLAQEGGNVVAAADPDTDRVYIVDLDTRIVRKTIELGEGDAPRRMAEIGDHRIAVTLASDAIAIVSVRSGEVQRVPACELPRGVAYDASRDRILVACREGRLVEVKLGYEGVSRSVELPRDLRDVVVAGQRIYVTRFKAAEVLLLDLDLNVVHRAALNTAIGNGQTPAVMWRAVGMDDGSLLVLHQEAQTQVGGVSPCQAPVAGGGGRYGSGGRGVRIGGAGGQTCQRAVVAPVLTRVTADGAITASPPIANGALMVDVAVQGTNILVADAGATVTTLGQPVRQFQTPNVGFTTLDPEEPPVNRCAVAGLLDSDATVDATTDALATDRDGPITSVTYDRRGRVVALVGVPALVRIGTSRIRLGEAKPTNEGYRIFHQDSGGNIACAGCHPEGEDDGLVWSLPVTRRTPALRGGIMNTAPFHWSGDLRDFEALLDEVFVGRMGGTPLRTGQRNALATWIDRLPAIAVGSPTNLDAVARGGALYDRKCASCHAQPMSQSLNVGTGESFQVPLLRGVMFRAPYLHDGCATTLADRFGRCATPAHGSTGSLDPQEIGDLVEYLETL